MKRTIDALERDLGHFKDFAMVKDYLKSYTIPRGPLYYDEDYY